MGFFNWFSKSVASEKISSEGIRIDVRTKEEYRTKHIDGAKHIPLEQITSQIEQLVKDKNRLIGVYCHSGIRSAMAKRRLKYLGYTNVVNEGGIKSLENRLKK